MIRETRFLISHAPYAIDLGSMTKSTYFGQVQNHYGYKFNAAWFRRRDGLNVACLGVLSTSQEVDLSDPAAVLARFTDGRYGGDCKARWGADNLWAPGANWDQMKEYEEFLRPMLDNYPEVPPGCDGWWTFKAGGKS